MIYEVEPLAKRLKKLAKTDASKVSGEYLHELELYSQHFSLHSLSLSVTFLWDEANERELLHFSALSPCCSSTVSKYSPAVVICIECKTCYEVGAKTGDFGGRLDTLELGREFVEYFAALYQGFFASSLTEAVEKATVAELHLSLAIEKYLPWLVREKKYRQLAIARLNWRFTQ